MLCTLVVRPGRSAAPGLENLPRLNFCLHWLTPKSECFAKITKRAMITAALTTNADSGPGSLRFVLPGIEEQPDGIDHRTSKVLHAADGLFQRQSRRAMRGRLTAQP